MKICPNCRKTYADDNLNFCLEDGSVLTMAPSEPAPTVMMSQPRPTDYTPGGTAPQFNPQIQSSFGNQPQYQVQPQKKSKAWLWILGVVGIVLLLCGGGFVGLVIIGMNANQTASNNSSVPTNTRGNTSIATNTKAPPPSPGTPGGDVETIDMSMFVKDFSIYGTTEMSGDELLMAAKQKDYYYVLVATDDYNTMGASTKLTVRNPENMDSRLGYGLIFHSDPQPLTKGYAFLIDSKKKRYRVVRHSSTNESSLVAWKNSTAIKDGSQENVLEIRDKGSDIELYINDQLVTTVKDGYDGTVGVPGLYSGDAAKIGFKKLEIRK